MSGERVPAEIGVQPARVLFHVLFEEGERRRGVALGLLGVGVREASAETGDQVGLPSSQLRGPGPHAGQRFGDVTDGDRERVSGGELRGLVVVEGVAVEDDVSLDARRGAVGIPLLGGHVLGLSAGPALLGERGQDVGLRREVAGELAVQGLQAIGEESREVERLLVLE